MLTVGSLFAGIGGFDLGLERAGMKVIWQSEIDHYASAVLRKHWPRVPNHGDIRTITAASVERPDVLCGGFPCQPHSVAGKRGGSSDDRNLWPEFARLVRDLGPRWVVAENVPGLRSTESGWFFGEVLRNLASVGYDAEWYSISAADVGAPHERERVWIVAYPGRGQRLGTRCPLCAGWNAADICRCAMGDADDQRRAQPQGSIAVLGGRPVDTGEGLGTADEPRLQGLWRLLECAGERSAWADGEISIGADGTPRVVKPGLPLLADGIPNRIQRLRTTGNAIVPQIAELIGRAILAAESAGR